MRVETTGNVTLDGTITAGGGLGNYGGGGSGGGILIACGRFAGSGALYAQGGNTVQVAEGGGGGGGRIGVWYRTSASDRAKIMGGNLAGVFLTTNITEAGFAFSGTASVVNGTGYEDGMSGTMVFLKPSAPGTLFSIR